MFAEAATIVVVNVAHSLLAFVGDRTDDKAMEACCLSAKGYFSCSKIWYVTDRSWSWAIRVERSKILPLDGESVNSYCSMSCCMGSWVMVLI